MLSVAAPARRLRPAIGNPGPTAREALQLFAAGAELPRHLDGGHWQRLQQRDYLLLERVDGLPGTLRNHSNQLLLLGCAGGHLQLQSGQDTGLQLRAGDLLLVNPGQSLDWQFRQPCRLLLVRIPCAELQRAALEFGLHCPPEGLRFELATRGGEQTASLLHLLLDAVRVDRSDLWSQALPWYQRMCDTLILHNWPHNLGQTLCSRPLQSPVLQKARQWLLAHIREETDIEVLASLCGVCSRTLYNLVRRETGMTPSEYVRALKIEQVYQMLCQGQHRSVTDIAVEYGFTNLGRFARQYRQQIGELPSATLRGREQG